MYGIPGYDPTYTSGRGPSKRMMWCKAIIFSVLMLAVIFMVMLGVQAVFVDTMRQAFPR